MTAESDLTRLRRIQAGARATLALGIGASLTANMLAADPSLIARLVAGWSPVALMLTVELLSRVPISGGRLSRLRVTAAAGIAAIAAWVSYWHMVQVSLDAGEAPVAAHLLPLSVDGLVVVASICLVEITNRLNLSSQPVPRPGTGRSAEPARSSSGAQPALAAAADREPAAASRRPATPSRPAPGALVRRLAADHPSWTQAQLADAAGCSVRTVRRHLTVGPHDQLDQGASSGPDSTELDHNQPAAATSATSNGSTP